MAVRVIIPNNTTWEPAFAPGYGWHGPQEFLFDSVKLTLEAGEAPQWVTTGEYVILGDNTAEITMYYTREESLIVWPLLIGFIVLLGFHWLQKRL